MSRASLVARRWPLPVLFLLVGLAMAFVAVIDPGPARAAQSWLDVARGIAGATPVASQQDIVNTRARPILAAETAHFSQSVGTSTLSLMGNSASGGAAEATYGEDIVQMFRITNSHATQAVCLTVVAKASSTQTCNALCTGLGAGVATCGAGGGALTDGMRLTSAMPPLNLTITGLDCICAEADTASTTVQATRISRAANL